MGPAEMRQKVGAGGREINVMLPDSGLDLRPESGAPDWGRTNRLLLGAGIRPRFEAGIRPRFEAGFRRAKNGFGRPAALLTGRLWQRLCKMAGRPGSALVLAQQAKRESLPE